MSKNKVEIELNEAAVGELMKSSEMMSLCERLAGVAMGQLGDGYAVTSRVGKTRLNVEIAADTDAAKKENLENNSILKALGAAQE